MATSVINNVTDLAAKTEATTKSAKTLSDDFSQFLTLLTTQLQNQDPLAPMDSTEFTNQLVQFSQVEQQINSNQKLDSLLALQLSAASNVALGYVGMDVSYLSSEMNYDGTTPIDVNYALGTEAVSAKVNIYDEEDVLVYSGAAPKDVGTNKFTWNGKKTNGEALPAGTYTVKIDALDRNDKAIENTTVVTGTVRGIETQNGVVYALVGDRAVALSSIVNATLPKTATPPTSTASTDTTANAA